MIEVAHLTKRYGSVTAVDDVSFSVEKGEILGFLGPNGAGKTTTMNVLAGCLLADKGTARVGGFDVAKSPVEVARRLGYLPEVPPLYPNMRVWDFLEFVATIREVPAGACNARIDFSMKAAGVGNRKNDLISSLSKGYRQRVGLASAILHEPHVLILDEPTIGLDPNQIVEIRNLIKELSKDKTVILSTHILYEVQLLCDRAAIIHEGKLVALDSIDRLRSQLKGAPRIRVEIGGKAEDITAGLQNLKNVVRVEPKGGGEDQGAPIWDLEAKPDADVRRDIFELAKQKGWVLLEMTTYKHTLEDVFVQLTKSDSNVPSKHASRRE